MQLKQGIYIITGIMASGKSTVAGLLAERCERSVHLRGDIFRKMIVKGAADMAPEPGDEALRQLRLRYHLAAAAADGYADEGFAVFLQDNYLGKEIDVLLAAIKTTPLYLITLDPDVESVAQREAGRHKTGYHSFGIGELQKVLHSENPRIGLWVDSSRMSPDETADAILRDIERARIR